MKKMPIELLTTRTASAQNGCPVIWDGNNIILATAPELNLLAIVRTLSTVSRNFAEQNTRVETNYQAIARLTPLVENLNNFIPNVAQRINAIEQIMSSETGVSVRLAQVEERTNSIEQNINTIIQGGSGKEEGQSLSSSWTAILTALENGSFISGEGGVSVSKTAGNPGQYKIKFTQQESTVSITSNSDLIKVANNNGSFGLSVDASRLSNYIGVGSGLSLVAGPAKLTIKPASTLITGDNTTTRVTFNELSGQFKVEAIGGTTGGGSGTGGSGTGGSGTGGGTVTTQTAIDNETIKKNASGELYLNEKYYRSSAGATVYESNTFGNPTPAISLSRVTKVSDAEFVQRLTPMGINSLALARTAQYFTKDLKTFVFNSANSTALNGSYYLLKDYNTTQEPNPLITSSVFSLQNNDPLTRKICMLDIDATIRVQNLTTAVEYPLVPKNLIYPFLVCSIINLSTAESFVAVGDIFRYGRPSGDGYGCDLPLNIKIAINNDMADKFKVGSLYMRAYVGIKVATSAEPLFKSAFLDRFAMAPKIDARIAFF